MRTKQGMHAPIGVFDSGMGGLTVVRHFRTILAGRDILYFGDTARVPYGSKSAETVTRFSRQNCRFLCNQGAHSIVVACNTSSALALPTLKKEFKIPLYDVVNPAAARAVEETRNGRIGVIGTHATVHSRAYERAIALMARDVKVFSRACPLFVPLAEEGWIDRPATLEIAREYLLPLKAKRIDTLILGCTHYPVLRETISLVMGKAITLIDSGWCCAEYIRKTTGLRSSVCEEQGRVRYFVSDMPERFSEIGRLFMGEELGEVAVVSLEK